MYATSDLPIDADLLAEMTAPRGITEAAQDFRARCAALVDILADLSPAPPQDEEEVWAA